jgi:hypothetical protein
MKISPSSAMRSIITSSNKGSKMARLHKTGSFLVLPSIARSMVSIFFFFFLDCSSLVCTGETKI